jgi:hypothetical protein
MSFLDGLISRGAATLIGQDGTIDTTVLPEPDDQNVIKVVDGKAAWGVPPTDPSVSSGVAGALAHIARTNNPHGTTRAQIGLATLSDMKAALDPAQHVVRVDDFTGGVTLTNSNFEAALIAALAYAGSLPHGAVVIMPPGSWQCFHAGEIVLPCMGYDASIILRGAGKFATRLIPPPGYSGRCIVIDTVHSPGALFFAFGGLEDFAIRDPTQTATGIGLFTTGLLLTHIRNFTVSGFLGTGGIGHKNTDPTNTTNSQNCLFTHVTYGQNYIGSQFDQLGPSVFVNCQWNQNGYVDIDLLGHNGIQMFESMCQSTVSTGGGGWNITNHPSQGPELLSIDSIYTEGNVDSFLRLYAPTAGESHLRVQRMQAAGAYAGKLFDLQGINYVDIQDCYHASVGIKARGCTQMFTKGMGNPVDDPSLWDIDTQSRLGLVAQSNGGVYQGSSLVAANLNALLSPVAKEIFDVRVASRISLASSTITSMAGLLHGDAALPPDASHKPAYTASDPNFGGKPSFTADTSTGKFLTATLSHHVQAGHNFGMLIVARFHTVGGSQQNGPQLSGTGPILSPMINTGGSGDHNFETQYFDGTVNSLPGMPTSDANAHAFFVAVNSNGAAYIAVDHLGSAQVAGTAPLVSDLTSLVMSIAFGSGAIDIAYVAVLQDIPEDVNAQPLKYMLAACDQACAEFGLY